MQEVRWIMGMVFLLCNSVYDIKKRTIWGKSILVFIPVVLAACLSDELWDIKGWLSACIPGIILILISWIKPTALGMGDGLCVWLMGFIWNLDELMKICMFAFGIASIVGTILILVKKATKTTQLPFVPFLFVATIIISVRGWLV